MNMKDSYIQKTHHHISGTWLKIFKNYMGGGFEGQMAFLKLFAGCRLHYYWCLVDLSCHPWRELSVLQRSSSSCILHTSSRVTNSGRSVITKMPALKSTCQGKHIVTSPICPLRITKSADILITIKWSMKFKQYIQIKAHTQFLKIHWSSFLQSFIQS